MFYRFTKLIVYLICVLQIAVVSVVQANEPVTVRYSERKPYQYTAEDGLPAGLLIGPTAKVLARAGVAVIWKSEPFNRSMMRIQANAGKDCSVGWYKTPEREAYANFTLPIFKDGPQIAFARADFAVPAGVEAKTLFEEARTRLLLKQSFVYGPYLDQLIGNMPEQQVHRVSVEMPTLLMMLKANRADLTIISQEEAVFYASKPDFPIQDFQLINLPDVPSGELRYLICSKRVPQAVIQRLNQAIRSELDLDAEPTALDS